METQKQFKRRFSFEFFPPKTDKGWEKLQGVRNTLAEVDPDFFSVTFGAGGSTRDRTVQTVLDLHKRGVSTASTGSSPCEATCHPAWALLVNCVTPMSW